MLAATRTRVRLSPSPRRLSGFRPLLLLRVSSGGHRTTAEADLPSTRRHIAEQFLAETLLLSALGGLAGTLLGVGATAIYALTQHWTVLIPTQALYGGTGAALVIGAMAGLYPAMRAAGLSPTEALRTA